MVDQKKAIQCDRKSGFVTTNPRQDSNSGPPSTKPAHLNHYTKELLVGARATHCLYPGPLHMPKCQYINCMCNVTKGLIHKHACNYTNISLSLSQSLPLMSSIISPEPTNRCKRLRCSAP